MTPGDECAAFPTLTVPLVLEESRRPSRERGEMEVLGGLRSPEARSAVAAAGRPCKPHRHFYRLRPRHWTSPVIAG